MMQYKADNIIELAVDKPEVWQPRMQPSTMNHKETAGEGRPSLVDLLNTCNDSPKEPSSHSNDKLLSNHRRRKHKSGTQTSPDDGGVSMGDVQKQLSQLRVSAEKYDWRYGGRRAFLTASSSLSRTLPASLNFNDKCLPNGKIKIKDIYKAASRKMQKLEVSLNRQQVALLEQQAGILQLRMSIVKVMMEFESRSKLIKNEITRMSDCNSIEHSLNASWPEISNDEGIDSPLLHNSWPQTRDSAGASKRNRRRPDSDSDTSWLHFSPESIAKPGIGKRLSLDIHTIHESTSEDLTDVSSSSPSLSSPSSPEDHPRQTLRRNIAPSNSCEMEPDGGGRLLVPMTAIKSDSCLDCVKAPKFKEFADWNGVRLVSSDVPIRTSLVLEQALQYIAETNNHRQRRSPGASCK